MKRDMDERVDGNFMRLQVISLLKLAVLAAGALLFLLTFVFLGFSVAPSTSRSDFTSTPTRCLSEFSLNELQTCATSLAMSEDVATVANDTSAVVDAILTLPTAEQQTDMLSCMLDHCSTRSNRPISMNDPEQMLYAHYSFAVHGLSQWNRYFYLQVAFPNDNTLMDHSFNVTMVPHVRGFYVTNDNDNNNNNNIKRKSNSSTPRPYVDMIPASRLHWLTVHCHRTELFCEPQYFLEFNEIDYAEYHVDVLFNATSPLPLHGRDARFAKTWGTRAFTNWLVVLKYWFVLLSLVAAIWYNRVLATLSAREQNLEQGWIAALSVALVFFNDPLFYLEATMGGNAVRLLSLVFQVSFFQLLLLFWLIALDNLRLQGCRRGVSNTLFFAPKIVFSGCFWLAMVVYYGYLKYFSNSDLVWDPLADNERFSAIRAVVGLFSFLYLFWFVMLSLLSRREFEGKRPRYRLLMVLSFVMVCLSFAGLASGAFSPAVRSAGEWTSFHALINIYVFALVYLYAPSSATLQTAQRRNQANAYGHSIAELEASPVMGGGVLPINLTDVEPQTLSSA